MKRPNLRLETEAMVLKILFDGKRASGIRYHKNGREENVNVSGEIVLAGGAINSPQLLQLSGIGPAEHLQGLGIDIVHDSPQVGANLQDHYQVAGFTGTEPAHVDQR